MEPSVVELRFCILIPVAQLEPGKALTGDAVPIKITQTINKIEMTDKCVFIKNLQLFFII